MDDGFSFERALDGVQDKVPEKQRESRIKEYQHEIGKFLSPPYLFNLPPQKNERLRENEEDQHYMCRNGNRAAVTGSMERLLCDPFILLTTKQREALQRGHDIIFNMPRDESASVHHWRTEEDMQKMHASIQEAYDILCSLSKQPDVKKAA